MKNRIKSIITKVGVVLAACFMFASFSPSLDGRAVVVEPGVFPQGLFAKTVGYLPGDIISVANITGETTVDLLVIGALDPSEGVAIMLSPEAANAIGIDKDANNIVKITKRSGQDERVYGTAIIAKQNDSLAVLDDDPVISEETTEAFVSETIAETAFAEEAVEEPAAEESVFEEEESEFEVPEEDIPEEEEAEAPEEEAEEEETEEDFEAEDESDFEDELAEEAVDEDEFEEEDFEEQFEDDTEADVEEDLEEEAVEAEEEEAETEDAFETVEADAEEDEEIALPFEEEEVESETIEETPVESSELVEEDIAPIPENTEAVEDTSADVEEDDDDELDSVMEAELEDYEENLETEEYEAIVLVPVETMPPAPSYAEEDDVEEVETPVETPVEEPAPVVVIEPVKAPEPKVEPVTAPVETKKSAGSYEKYMVNSLSDLKSGKYYIQIAALSSDDNIMEIVNKYGNNYPITIVPMTGGIRKQVLIGPLSMDEYAVVLARFKSYGYKDAFLRKIK